MGVFEEDEEEGNEVNIRLGVWRVEKKDGVSLIYLLVLLKYFKLMRYKN